MNLIDKSCFGKNIVEVTARKQAQSSLVSYLALYIRLKKYLNSNDFKRYNLKFYHILA